MTNYGDLYSNLLQRLGAAASLVLGDKHDQYSKRTLLCYACEEIIPLMRHEFPPEHHERWDALWAAMQRGEGSIQASIAEMTDDAVQRWCDTVVLLYVKILESCWRERP